jgi:hypothetical protein
MTIVWEWGADFDLLVRNCEKYVSLEWQEDTKECAISLHGIERTEGVVYYITGYTTNRANVAEIASKLLSAAWGTKIRYCDVELSKSEFSKGVDTSYKEEELSGRVELLLEKVKQRVLETNDTLSNKAEETGKELVVSWELYLSCVARGAEVVYVVDCHDLLLEVILPEIKTLASSLGQIVGFSLDEKVEDPVVTDTDEDEEHIYAAAIERPQLIK